MRLASWNVNRRNVWSELAADGVDVGLLQEVAVPPPHGTPPGAGPLELLPDGAAGWTTEGWERRPWRTAIARVSDRVTLEPIPTSSTSGADWQVLQVSRPGTITAAIVAVEGVQRMIAVSVYAPWERPLGRDWPCWSDGSAHRLLSDLTTLLHDPRKLPVLVAGDWNLMHGYGEEGSEHWAARYRTVFDRAAALGLEFCGPRLPNGRQADPWPKELPIGSECVPTFTPTRDPLGAKRQIDFVFASASLAPRVRTRACNWPAEWGPSDHCRILIDVDV